MAGQGLGSDSNTAFDVIRRASFKLMGSAGDVPDQKITPHHQGIKESS